MSVPKEILENPKISVIIPAYNARKFIAEAIESVLNQTFPAHEIIVVDDGSTDGTGEFVEKRFGNKVRLIRQENKGMGAARNAGIKVATGNIFQFLDADDLLLPNKFEVQLDFWRRNPEFDIVYCDHCYFVGEGAPGDLPTPAPLPQGILVDVALRKTPAGVHCFLVPQHVMGVVGQFNEDRSIQVVADRDFWFRCALHGFTFGYVPQVLALTRRHGANSTANQLKRMQAKINYGYRLLSMPIPRHLIKFVHRELAESYAELALAQLAARQWKASWVSLWKAWHHHCAAAKLAGNRDKALWLVDLLRYIDQFRKALLGKATLDEDPVLR
jgi:glycosyltransferase involved in cell wall biosynthesis